MLKAVAARQAHSRLRLTHSLWPITLRFVLLLIAAFGPGLAQAGTGPAVACSPTSDSSQSLWVADDFDGDDVIDLARLQFGRNREGGVLASQVDLFAFCEDSVPAMFGSFPRIRAVLSARDVDADHDQDLVLREPFAGEVLGVWLNDGNGGFTEAEPSDFPGAGRNPPNLKKPALRFRQPAASPSNSYASNPRIRSLAGIAPSSPHVAVDGPRRIASGWRDARQDRGPPLLSC